MIICRDMTEIATDYVEGALPLRTQLAARLHLLICSMCRKHYDQLRKATRLLRRVRLPSPAPDVEAELVALASKASLGPAE